MTGLGDILTTWSCRREEPVALATVVRTNGSTYRKAGARLLISCDGATTGLVSGGCLEQEVAERGIEVLRRGKPELVAYNTRRLFGCNGMLEILVEPVWPEQSGHFLAAAAAKWDEREALVSTTLFEGGGVPDRLLGSYAVNEELTLSAKDAGWLQPIFADESRVLRSSPLEHRSYEMAGGSVATLWQRLAPPVRLLIFGGGPDALPLALVAKQVGWDATIVCHPGQSKPELPQVMRLACWAPDECEERIKGDARTVATIMTHHYGRDLAYLKALLPKRLAYIGLLGPRARRDRLLSDLADVGYCPSEEELLALHGPAGLDIGADGPEEIALSILAEIRAVLSGRTGGSLRYCTGAIHPVAESAL